MKTNTYKLEKDNTSIISDALNEIEKAANYNNLSKNQMLHLRLLAEEIIGIQKGILGFTNGEFYMENEKNQYKICLHANVLTDNLTQEKFIKMSTNNENNAFKGLTGKIRMIANCFSLCDSTYAMQYYNIGSMSTIPLEYNFAWSLQQYKADSKNNKEAWDELEHSIAASIADEIIVGATSNYIEIIAIKNFD